MKCQVIQLRASPATFHGLMDADRELGHGREPDLILAFLPPDGNVDATLEAMAEVWPSARRAGCETARQIAGDTLSSSGCLQCFWLDDPEHGVRIEVLRGFHESPPEAASVESICRSLTGADAVLLLADGLRFPVPSLIAEMRRHRTTLPPAAAGVLASRPEPYDAAAAGARVFLDTHVYPSACLLIAFEGVAMEVELVHDFRPASPIYTVTRAEDQVVHEIDGEPAVEWYRRFFTVGGQLAPMPRTAHSFPLMIEGPDPNRHHLCRALRAFDEPPGAVTYWGDVHQGEHVRLGLSQDPSLVRVAQRLASGGGADAAFVGAFAGREALLAEGAESELVELQQALKGIALAGGFTFGEIGPGGDGGLAVHNQTALLALLREK